MSTLLLQREVRVDGVLTDATSAVLRDSTNSYGVKRADTGEILVAAGTAMGHNGTGLYSVTIADAAAGVTYLWGWQIVLDGDIYQDDEEVVAPADAVAASYLTLDEADAIAGTLLSGLVAAYMAAEPPQKQAALEAASADVDGACRWQGRKYDGDGAISGTAQVLEFPRLAYGDASYAIAPTLGSLCNIWDWDADTATAVVPEAVKRAVVIQAADRLDGRRLGRLDGRAGLIAQTTGSLSETYTAAGPTEAMRRLCPEAAALVERYRLRSGGLL